MLNLENRKTERAYALAIRASIAAGDPGQACALAQAAALRPRTGAELDDLDCVR